MSLCGSRISLQFHLVLLVTNEVPRGVSTTAPHASRLLREACSVVPLQTLLGLFASAAVPSCTCAVKCNFRLHFESWLAGSQDSSHRCRDFLMSVI